MHIDITPETERIVQEELRSGHFRSIDELIMSGIQALHKINLLQEQPTTVHAVSSASRSNGKEKAREFVEWAKNHPSTPPLSDEAISRASLNPDRW